MLFFNPFGFRREGTNDPVVIVKFKRPGDEHLSKDPVDQVLGYIEELQSRPWTHYAAHQMLAQMSFTAAR